MDYKEIIGLITVILAFAVYVPYYASILSGKTKPHLYTYVIGAALSTVAFFGSWISGGGAGSWSIGASALLVIGVVLLSLKYGTKDVKRVDAYFAAGAVVAIVPWILTKDPTLSVVLVALIEYLAIAPTLRKTWNDPSSEPYSVWGLNTFKHGLTVAAVTNFSLATAFYPAAMVLMNVILTGEIILRRLQKRTPKTL